MQLIAEFEIQGLPSLVNKAKNYHWRRRNREAQLWKRLVMEQCIYRNIHQKRFPAVYLELTRCSPVQPDFDNLCTGFKHVIDGFKACGVIEDDSPKYVTLAFFWEKATKLCDRRIKIRLSLLDKSDRFVLDQGNMLVEPSIAASPQNEITNEDKHHSLFLHKDE